MSALPVKKICTVYTDRDVRRIFIPGIYVIRLNRVACFLLTDRGRVKQRLLPDERDGSVPVMDARSEERLGQSGFDVTVPRLEGDLSPGRRLGSSRNLGHLIVSGEIIALQNLNL